ncbi:unnamed protein product [Closterium sp. Yama58-4]|nr:unnamed protein product [Closterium sp. Yama58-4]
MADTASPFDLRELESQSSVTLSQVDDGDSSSTTTSSSTVSCQGSFGVFARRRRRQSSRREMPAASPRAGADHSVIGGFPATRRAAPTAPAPELPRLLHHEMRRDIRRSDGEESGDEGDGGGGGSKSSRGSAAVTILKDAAQTVARKVRGADAAAWGQLGALQGGALSRPLAGAARRQKPPLALKPRRFNERDGCPSPASSGEMALMRPPKSPASSGEIALLEAEEMLFGANQWSPASSGEMPLLGSREFAPLPPTPERRRADYEEGSEGGSEGVVVEVAPGGGSMHRSTSPSLWNQLGSVSENLLLGARQKKGVDGLPAEDPRSPTPLHPSSAPKAAHTRYARKAQHRHGLSLGDVSFADSPVGMDARAPLPPSALPPVAVGGAGAPASSISADNIPVGSFGLSGSTRSGRSSGSGGKKSSKGRVAARASASAIELDRWSVLPYGGAREKPCESRESTRVKQVPSSKEHGGVTSGVTSGAAAVPGDFLSSYFGDAPDAYVGEFALQEARNAARNAHKKTTAQTESAVTATPRKQLAADADVRQMLAERQAEHERAQERRREEQQQWADEQQRLQQQLQLLRQQQKLQLLQAFHETNQQHLRPCDFVLGRPYSSLLRRFVLAPQELGSGQFGVIRKCVERGTHRVLACKTILKSNIVAMQDAADIRHEVAVMEALKGHPHVVKIEDTCEDEEAVHIVMELCSGGDLFDRVKDEGRLKERTAAIACRQLVQALMWCHVSGVVHRDVKPENILLKGRREGSSGADEQSKGNMGAAAAVLGGIMGAPAKGAGGGAADEDDIHVKLADFGVATFTRGEPCTEELGTLQYMAPEVLAGTYGPAADIWSAGVVLHIMLSGRTPFFASLGRTVQEAILHGPVRMRGPHWEGVSEDAKSLVRAMLDKDASTRITAKEILGHPWIAKYTQ